MQPWSSLVDEEIVRLILAGETWMFEVLVRRHSQQLYRAARAILCNDADAEDAVQQAYLNGYRHLDGFEGRARFSTWLTRIVVYEALAERRRTRASPTDSLDQKLSNRIESSAIGPERQAYVGQLGAVLRSAVDSLPDSYRSVFILREVDGLSTAQAAQRLYVSEGAVKARLHRAKGLLQQALLASIVTKGTAYRERSAQDAGTTSVGTLRPIYSSRCAGAV